jgi:hypothetical protein
MTPKFIVTSYLITIFFLSCSKKPSVSIVNEKKGKLHATVNLHETSVTKFPLDSVSAPRIQYCQVYSNGGGKRSLAFLNPNNKSIYLYDFESQEFIKSINLEDVEPSNIDKPTAFHIKSLDSIYVYNKTSLEIFLINSRGNVLKKISLIGDQNIKTSQWISKFPQYTPQTAMPFIETPTELLFAGQCVESIPDTIITRFNFIAHINFKTSVVNFSNTYPESLYGLNYNWSGGLFTQVYTDLSAERDKLILSFPVSHDLYISDLRSNKVKSVYGGSNQAGTISSIIADNKETSKSLAKSHFIKNDEYAAIKYDKYRKLYYRFLRRSLPEGNENTDLNKKPIAVIIMDESFNYLGETTLGSARNWYLKNAFVTKEGLNIEYLEDNLNEEFLTLRTFTVKNL